MTQTLLNEAMGLIDDDLISETALLYNNNKKFRRLNWIKISTLVVCIIVVICFVPNIMRLFKADAEDPNWFKYNVEATSVEEAIKLYGEDLLLNKMVLKDQYPEPYLEFILAYKNDDGSLNNRDSWEKLDVGIYYGGKRFSVSEDYVHLDIYFNDSRNLYGHGGKREIFKVGASRIDINNVAVTYKRYSTFDFKYVFSAEFSVNGYVFFLDTFSKENDRLFWSTITQILDS